MSGDDLHDPTPALQLLKLLADETRWRLLNELRQSDRQVGELVAQLGLPQNLVSYHLGMLRQAGFVRVHRSAADGRALYYELNLAALQRAHRQIAADLLLPADESPGASSVANAPYPNYGPIVFLCTGNSIRSQIAEAWLRHLSGGQIVARSAGVDPHDIHPHTLGVMAEVGIDTHGQWSKGLEALKTLDTLAPYVVVTVCDNAREECRYYITDLSPAITIHWSVADPQDIADQFDTPIAAFRATRDHIRERVIGLMDLLKQRWNLT
jgi:ArsR family transcriptional regulator